MQTRRVVGLLLLAGGLLCLSACDDDTFIVPPSATNTPGTAATPTTKPAATLTPTIKPAVTATPTTVVPATLTPTEIVGVTATPTTSAGVGTATPTTSAGVATATATPTSTELPPTATPTSSEVALGTRTFTLYRDSMSATDPGSTFNSTALGGFDVSLTWGPGPLVLTAGPPDANGKATVQLAQDATIAVATLGSQLACIKIIAAGSTGTIDCDGGSPADISFEQNSNGSDPEDPEPTIAVTGGDSGPGALVLYAKQAYVQIGSTNLGDCDTATYGTPAMTVLTTGTLTGTVKMSIQGGDITLSATGQNFDCSTWTMAGTGRLVMALPGFDIALLGDQDAMQTMTLADGPLP